MPLNSAEEYTIEKGRLRLVDPELGLNVDAPFDPVLLPEKPLWGMEIAEGFFITGNVGGTEFYVEKDGRPHGQCRLYYPSKRIKGEMFYREGRLHGPASYYGEEGNVLSSSWYVDGRQQGKCRWYYPDGKVCSLQRYKDGLYEGKQEYFHPDGRVKTVVTYSKGLISNVFLAEKAV